MADANVTPDVEKWKAAANRAATRNKRVTGSDGVNERVAVAAQLGSKRPPHKQPSIEERFEQSTFEACQFVGRYVDMKINRRGDALIQIHVDRRGVKAAQSMVDSLGVPLSIDVQRWRRYDALQGNDPGPDGATGPGHEA